MWGIQEGQVATWSHIRVSKLPHLVENGKTRDEIQGNMTDRPEQRENSLQID